MATAVDLDANVIVGGYGLCDYIRNANRKMRLIQGKVDIRGNLLAREDFDALAIILRSSASSKERNKASQSTMQREPFGSITTLYANNGRASMKRSRRTRSRSAVLPGKRLLRFLPCLMS
jgi:hypothetical protein